MRVEAPDLTSAILERIATTPDKAIMTFLSVKGVPCQYTYRALHAMAQASALRLREAGVGPGDIVALFGKHDANLVSGFLAVLLTGAIPTIGPYRASFNHVEVYRQRLIDIVHSAEAKAALVEPETLSWLTEHAPGTTCLAIVPPMANGEDEVTLIDHRTSQPHRHMFNTAAAPPGNPKGQWSATQPSWAT